MLDLFFRKYAWTANLVLLFVAAWLTAKTVNTLVGAVIRPEPRAEVAIAPTAPPRPALPATLDIDRLYKLIGQEPPREVEADARPGAHGAAELRRPARHAVEERPPACSSWSASSPSGRASRSRRSST